MCTFVPKVSGFDFQPSCAVEVPESTPSLEAAVAGLDGAALLDEVYMFLAMDSGLSQALDDAGGDMGSLELRVTDSLQDSHARAAVAFGALCATVAFA